MADLLNQIKEMESKEEPGMLTEADLQRRGELK